MLHTDARLISHARPPCTAATPGLFGQSKTRDTLLPHRSVRLWSQSSHVPPSRKNSSTSHFETLRLCPDKVEVRRKSHALVFIMGNLQIKKRARALMVRLRTGQKMKNHGRLAPRINSDARGVAQRSVLANISVFELANLALS